MMEEAKILIQIHTKFKMLKPKIQAKAEVRINI